MSLRKAKGASRPLTPIGNHVARLCQIIDLGTQDDERWGAKQKVRFTWELPEETKDFGKGEPEPFLISRLMGFVYSKNSHLKKIVDGMLGREVTGDEQDNLDKVFRNLLGQPCMVNVIHVRGTDATFANVDSVAPCPAKLKKDVPELHNQPIFFEVEMGPESREFLLLPDFLKSQISKCQEWRDNGKEEKEDADQLRLFE